MCLVHSTRKLKISYQFFVFHVFGSSNTNIHKKFIHRLPRVRKTNLEQYGRCKCSDVNPACNELISLGLNQTKRAVFPEPAAHFLRGADSNLCERVHLGPPVLRRPFLRERCDCRDMGQRNTVLGAYSLYWRCMISCLDCEAPGKVISLSLSRHGHRNGFRSRNNARYYRWPLSAHYY